MTEAAPTQAEAANEKRLADLLDAAGIPVRIHRHKPLFTVEQSRAEVSALPGAHTKNLFLKDRKGALTLVTCLDHRRIRIADLEKAIGARRLSFASAVLLEEALGVAPGSVTPFALLNDTGRRVRLVLDSGMMAMEQLNFHPLHNKATFAISAAGFRAFLTAVDHEAEEADFDALEALAAARAEKTG